MEFINNTSSPALSFEGVDAYQEFHVIVTRHTYTWDETGLLTLAQEQDPLCMTDELVDPEDIMSGVLQESDLCHYKPKCDVLVIGHAYAPRGKTTNQFSASLRVKTPDKIIFSEPIKASKYLFQEQINKAAKPKASQRIKGDILIDKTLLVLGEQGIESIDESVAGNYKLFGGSLKKVNKVSLNPSSSLGGYCLLDNDQPNLDKLQSDKLIPEEDRRVMPIRGHSAPVAYFSQDNSNPYGTGYLTSDYIKAVTPHRLLDNGQYRQKLAIPQIQYAAHRVTDITLSKLSNGKLDKKEHSQMVAGFGICAKTHPDRYQYMGTIDDGYIERAKKADSASELMPEGFDFAIWNCAYPDQQIEKMVGNEWVSLTNLCHPDTPAAKVMTNGDTKLTLYLPETLAYVLTNSHREDMPESEVPMKLDTIIILPDEQKVNLVWRGIVSAAYDPKTILLEVADREKQQAIKRQYFTQKGDIVRPYEQGAQS